MSTGFLLSSGVGQIPGAKYDGIGQLAEKLEALGVAVKLNRMHKDRFRMECAVAEAAAWLAQFDDRRMAGHSRGVRFCCEVARKKMGRPIHAIYSADGWSPAGLLAIPPNVLYLASWSQVGHRPAGVEIFCEGETLWIKNEPLEDMPHKKMPCLEEFQAAVLSAANQG